MMELKIKSKTDNLFFNRTEVVAEILNQGEPTPKRGDVRQALASALNVDANLVVIRSIKPGFGFKSKCAAAVYKSKEDIQKFEPAYIIGRETGQKTHKQGKAK